MTLSGKVEGWSYDAQRTKSLRAVLDRCQVPVQCICWLWDVQADSPVLAVFSEADDEGSLSIYDKLVREEDPFAFDIRSPEQTIRDEFCRATKANPFVCGDYIVLFSNEAKGPCVELAN